MSAPRKYEQEFRDRAVRMYRERLAEPGQSKRGARRHVDALLDLNPETLRKWAEERDRVESGRSPAPLSAESEEVRARRRPAAEDCRDHRHGPREASHRGRPNATSPRRGIRI